MIYDTILSEFYFFLEIFLARDTQQTKKIITQMSAEHKTGKEHASRRTRTKHNQCNKCDLKLKIDHPEQTNVIIFVLPTQGSNTKKSILIEIY